MSGNLTHRLSDFVGSLFDHNTAVEQDLASAYCDRQYDTLIPYIKIIRQKLNKMKITIINYGCGENANLFYILDHICGHEFTKNISYIGINKNQVLSNLKFKEIIEHYANQTKSI